MTPNEALAKFMTRLATAAQELAEELQSGGGTMAPEDEAGSPPNLGSRQEKVYRILVSADDEGLPTRAIAAEMKYEVPNTYLTLQSLGRLGLAELVPGSKPQRWRLHPRQRGTAGPYLLAAQQVRAGEWTTYGDLSIALRGDDKGARAVGRAAATLPDFPNPHRILKAGGVIPAEWHDDHGAGPEECQRRLSHEGISFDAQGRAEPGKRVSWEDVRERLRRAGVAVPPRLES